MAVIFRDEREYGEAHAHIERAKSHAVDDPYKIGRTMKLRAEVWYRQDRLQDAKSETLLALENYEKAGAAHNAERCRSLLQVIERAMKKQLIGVQGERLEITLRPT